MQSIPRTKMQDLDDDLAAFAALRSGPKWQSARNAISDNSTTRLDFELNVPQVVFRVAVNFLRSESHYSDIREAASEDSRDFLDAFRQSLLDDDVLSKLRSHPVYIQMLEEGMILTSHANSQTATRSNWLRVIGSVESISTLYRQPTASGLKYVPGVRIAIRDQGLNVLTTFDAGLGDLVKIAADFGERAAQEVRSVTTEKSQGPFPIAFEDSDRSALLELSRQLLGHSERLVGMLSIPYSGQVSSPSTSTIISSDQSVSPPND